MVMCVQSRFAEIRKNLSFQSSHLQALGSVFTWMMYAYDKYAKCGDFAFCFLKKAHSMLYVSASRVLVVLVSGV